MDTHRPAATPRFRIIEASGPRLPGRTRSALALGLALALLAVAGVGRAGAEARFLVLASTTSPENSGLFAAILPEFEAKTGIQVRVVAVGTGQALRLAERGDADVVLVHHRPSEDAFVAAGHGTARYDVMANDFVLVGPRSDPAGVRGLHDAAAALARIAAAEAPFVSRGDDSGTHEKELEMWAKAGVDPEPASGRWYRETGAGMGATLNTASGLGAYTLSDRGTWLRFRNREDLEVLLEGDPQLRNPYGLIPVSPARHPHVKAEEARAFVDWMLSPEGQQAIADFRIEGEPAFFPTARTP